MKRIKKPLLLLGTVAIIALVAVTFYDLGRKQGEQVAMDRYPLSLQECVTWYKAVPYGVTP